MIVVADSGSTKTDWRFVDSDGKTVQSIKSMGFNPYFQDSETIQVELVKAFGDFISSLAKVKNVYYYGAGCSSDELCEIVKIALEKIFFNAEIIIKHDMIAASLATFGNQSGMACILGTGANSCIWDGQKIIDNVPSHGYILGDEGSGSYLGKELLKLYVNNQLDEELKKSFDETFKISSQQIVKNVYQSEKPNFFLASFAVFYSMHKDNVVLQEIIRKGFVSFFEVRIKWYKNYQSYDLGFVGSIAFIFQDILKEVASIYGLNVQVISKCPVDGLIEFHTEKVIQ